MTSTAIAGTTDPRILEARRRAKERRRRIPSTFYWMALPAFLLFFLLHTLPVLQGLFYSFTDYAGYGTWNWVGFKNYVNLFSDDRVRHSYLFTLQFAAVATVLINAVSLAIAVFLNAKIKFRTAFRGIFFMPYVMSILIVGYIFNFIFSNSLPWFGEKLGIGWLETNILANEDLAWLGIVVVQTWSSMAFAIIIYLAGLQTIDPQLYEAASLDGASGWLQFRSITFPLLAAFFTINMVLTLKNMLMVFDLIFSLTNGGPGTSTESISFLIYKGGFEGGEFAYQMANAIVLFILIVILAIFQLRILQKREVHA
jgi:raffinose/stachyose/melibiose transport system permease protein